MKSDLRELWLSVIGAVMRFFDNRFNPYECKACKTLETECARLREQNSSLVDRLLGTAHQPAEEVEAANAKLETMHRSQKPWHILRRELELSHRRQPNTEDMKSDLASFEKAIKELEA